MKYKFLCVVFLVIHVFTIEAQDSKSKNQRLDFAKMYIEVGATYLPSFRGQQLVGSQVSTFETSPTVNPYLTWGAFHFWGHAEFYVSFPLGQLNLNANNETSHQLLHSVATGARLYPWVVKEGTIRPYIGVNWGALDFKQILKPSENQTELSKDFMLNYDIGVIYNYKKIGLRLGVNYFDDNKWKYPLSKTQFSEITTPQISFQLGMLYAFDATKDNTKENIEKWNKYPTVSKLSYDAKNFGDIFIGAGPSISYSLKKSEYNGTQFPYLKQQLTSKGYFDIAIGYHFNKANFFTAISYRNPVFETEGFGSKQIIKKTSVAFEINKFLIDYSGFTPYVGINIAYDKLHYEEYDEGVTKQKIVTNNMEPGFTFGWDIVPGKTDEALILRTNLRWYPFSEFEVDGQKFNFSQLEYNLIQVVFYPGRLKKRTKQN